MTSYLLKIAFDFTFARKDVNSKKKKASSKVSAQIQQHVSSHAVYYRPKINGAPQLFPEEYVRLLPQMKELIFRSV